MILHIIIYITKVNYNEILKFLKDIYFIYFIFFKNKYQLL